MILIFIKLGIKILLKTYCQKIQIKRLELILKNNIFKGKVKNIIIEAEKIIFNGFYINYAKLEGFNLNIDLNIERGFFKVKDFDAYTTLKISEENLKEIINNENQIHINNPIREFTSQKNMIERISFNKQSIFFYFLKDKKLYKLHYGLDFINNNLILKNINSNKNLLIPFDKNIIFKSINFNNDYLEIKLRSIVKKL